MCGYHPHMRKHKEIHMHTDLFIYVLPRLDSSIKLVLCAWKYGKESLFLSFMLLSHIRLARLTLNRCSNRISQFFKRDLVWLGHHQPIQIACRASGFRVFRTQAAHTESAMYFDVNIYYTSKYHICVCINFSIDLYTVFIYLYDDSVNRAIYIKKTVKSATQHVFFNIRTFSFPFIGSCSDDSRHNYIKDHVTKSVSVWHTPC